MDCMNLTSYWGSVSRVSLSNYMYLFTVWVCGHHSMYVEVLGIKIKLSGLALRVPSLLSQLSSPEDFFSTG